MRKSRIIKSIVTLFIFSLIGIMLRMETIEFMIASNLAPNGEVGLVDLTVNLLTSPLMSVYWILPLTFSLFYYQRLEVNFAEENLSIRLIRYQSRNSFMVNQLQSLVVSVVEYLLYLLGGCFLAWILLGHRLTQTNHHFIITLSPSSNIATIFAVILVFVILGLIMVGLITQLFFLLSPNGFVVFFLLLGLSLMHTISHTLGRFDTLTAWLPFTQFSRGSSNFFIHLA